MTPLEITDALPSIGHLSNLELGWGSYIVLTILSFIGFLYWCLKVPSNMPKNIPSVPIYLSLSGMFSSMGQDEIYDYYLRDKMEKYGAVKIWFAGQWSILVTRPDLVTDMFRNEDLYAKAGSQKKIPWGVIAKLVGDNIINSHGDDWRLYTSIMKPGIQKRIFDTTPLVDKSRKFVDVLLKDQETAGKGSAISVISLCQRYAIAAMGESFLDVDFGTLDRPGVRIEVLQTIIKGTLFIPIFFSFPQLDKYPWLFKSRRRAFDHMQEFEDLLCEIVRNRPNLKNGKKIAPEDELVVHMLERALEEGKIDERQFRDNLKITFLTAHENAQQLMNSTFYELGFNQTVQNKLRAEILATGVTDPTADTVNKLPYLTATVFELLRLYPPVSQLINRVTTRPALLGNQIAIPNRTWVGWNAPGVHTSTKVWGPDAKKFIPERWGTDVDAIQSKFRREGVRGNFISFNGHSRKCLGQGFVLLQMKIVLFEMLRRVRWDLQDGYKRKLTSGGILSPVALKVVVHELEQTPSKTEKLVDLNGHVAEGTQGTNADCEWSRPEALA
ncbi:MAG: hypothetical protein M1817_000811 [Caeruleum heppii]|nr:MAG: hypothetical protein M1817_000811 [Caeruleum heppii]